MNEEQPQKTNIDERLKKIDAAQKEIAAMPPSPEQILLEQALEIQAQNQKASTETKAALEDAKTEIPAGVKAELKENRQQENNDRTASEQRIVAAVAEKLKPATSNEELRQRMNAWGVFLAVLVVIGILIVILTHH
jgi:predicted metal-dependent peptidase